MEAREINQAELTSECWSVQFRGTEHCLDCEYYKKKDCGGKNIIKTGKNIKGFAVPLGKDL